MNSTFARILSAALLASALSGCVGISTAQAPSQSTLAPTAPGISADRLSRLTEQLQSYVDQGQLAGAVVQIRLDGHDVYSEAVGWRDKEARAPCRRTPSSASPHKRRR